MTLLKVRQDHMAVSAHKAKLLHLRVWHTGKRKCHIQHVGGKVNPHNCWKNYYALVDRCPEAA
jgi:hypothetical protein